MVTASKVVERFKQARLPAGSIWNEIAGDQEHKWVTIVATKEGKWSLVVLKTEDKMKPFVIRVTPPDNKAKQAPNRFRLVEEAKREAEYMAQALKKSGKLSQDGWKPV